MCETLSPIFSTAILWLRRSKSPCAACAAIGFLSHFRKRRSARNCVPDFLLMELQNTVANHTAEKLAIEGVSKTFKGRGQMVKALDNINLQVREGEFVCMVG